MVEQTQVQQVTTKDTKKVEVGKRLAEYNHKKREDLAQMAKTQSEPKLTYYGAGAVAATRTLSVLGYCVYQFKRLHRRLRFTKLMKLRFTKLITDWLVSLKWSRL